MSEVTTIRTIPSDDSVSSPTPRLGDAAAQAVEFDLALSRAMWRLKMVSCKLDLATTHWEVPSEVASEDLGAVMTMREVALELDGLYCALSDLIHKAGLWVGPWVDRLDEGAPENVFQND
jgi:hypothetical protein